MVDILESPVRQSVDADGSSCELHVSKKLKKKSKQKKKKVLSETKTNKKDNKRVCVKFSILV